jgi:hypothetical protein
MFSDNRTKGLMTDPTEMAYGLARYEKHGIQVVEGGHEEELRADKQTNRQQTKTIVDNRRQQRRTGKVVPCCRLISLFTVLCV